jgi:hypothetical protein
VVLVEDAAEDTLPPYGCVDRHDDTWVVVGRALTSAASPCSLAWTEPLRLWLDDQPVTFGVWQVNIPIAAVSAIAHPDGDRGVLKLTPFHDQPLHIEMTYIDLDRW